MNSYCIFQMLLTISLLITLTSGRAIYYDELDDDNGRKLSSGEEAELEYLKSELAKLTNIDEDDGNDVDDDDNEDRGLVFDSDEERKFHARSVTSSSKPTNTMSSETRQAIIDILQKALDQGWRPNLKHYIPATRFGRHRR